MGGWFEEGGFYRHRELTALGLRHGVSTRSLGNMKDASAMAGAARSLRLDPALLRTLRQVHGRRVVKWEEAGGAGGGGAPEADAMTVDRPDAALGIYVADCLPLFVWERSGLAVGLAHLGWRGTAAGLARAVVESLLLEYGIHPRSLRVAVGPHIRDCCYAVGPEVAGQFPKEALAPGEGNRSRLSLARAVAVQLREAGVRPSEMDLDAPCTGCRPQDFFSFRREKSDLRMLAMAALS